MNVYTVTAIFRAGFILQVTKYNHVQLFVKTYQTRTHIKALVQACHLVQGILCVVLFHLFVELSNQSVLILKLHAYDNHYLRRCRRFRSALLVNGLQSRNPDTAKFWPKSKTTLSNRN